jgi:hypothetical protein
MGSVENMKLGFESTMVMMVMMMVSMLVVVGVVSAFDYPKTTKSMEDGNLMLDMLYQGIPFGYAHFNDGEIRAINITNCFKEKDGQLTTDWGWQKCSPELGTAMLAALTNTAPNFYVGIPCKCEWEGERTQLALDYLNLSSNNIPLRRECDVVNPVKNLNFEFAAKPWLKDRLTTATIFINGNYEKMWYQLSDVFNNINKDGARRVHAVVSQGSDVNNLPFKVLPIYAARQHAFEANYAELRTSSFISNHFKQQDVVIIMLGPLGRILASEWTLISSDITFIDMGSFYDIELHDRHFPADRLSPRACNDLQDRTRDQGKTHEFRPLSGTGS